MKWSKTDADFLRKQQDFCVDYCLKGYDLQESGMILTEALNRVEGKNSKGTATPKVVVKWC